jgi:hypothetical protein
VLFVDEWRALAFERYLKSQAARLRSVTCGEPSTGHADRL